MESLRTELMTLAQKQRETGIGFQPTQAELTLTLVGSQTDAGVGGIKWFVELEGSHTRSNEVHHQVKLILTPVDLAGYEILIDGPQIDGPQIIG